MTFVQSATRAGPRLAFRPNNGYAGVIAGHDPLAPAAGRDRCRTPQTFAIRESSAVTYDLHLESDDGIRIEAFPADRIAVVYDHCEERLARDKHVKRIHLHLGERRLHTIMRRDGVRED